MKSHRITTVCIVYDEQIADLVGLKSAQAFEWLYSFLHLSKKRNGEVYAGRRWGAFTYNQLADLSDALPNAHAWRRALAHLEEKKLIYRDHAPGLGNYYAINFHELRKKLAAGFTGYQLDMDTQIHDLPNWDSPTPPVSRPRRVRKSEQNAQTHPEQSAQTTLSAAHRPPEHHAQTPIYRFDSSLDSSDDKSSTDVDEASLTIDPPKSPYQGIYRMSQAFMPDFDRERIGSMLGIIQNGQKDTLVVDAATTDLFAVYYMLHKRGALWKERFPEDEGEFIAAFRNYLRWQESDSHQRELKAICDQFPNWRTRLFVGDYTALQAEVKAWQERQTITHQRGSPFVRTDSERRRAGHKPDPERRRRLP